MMTRRTVLGLVSIGVFARLGGCDLLIPTWTYRYRLTVAVESDGKVHSGSSVIEIKRQKGANVIGGSTRGEAAVVDFAGGDALFALLCGGIGGQDWPLTVAHYAFADRLGTVSMTDEKALTRLTEMTGESAALTQELYPALVRFQDIRDPETVEMVDPQDLQASLRANAKIRITIQLTDDPPTSGIEHRFTWWSSRQVGYLDGARTHNSQKLGNILDVSAFKRDGI